MPLIVTANTTAECPRTDCNIYWWGGGGKEKIKTKTLVLVYIADQPSDVSYKHYAVFMFRL